MYAWATFVDWVHQKLAHVDAKLMTLHGVLAAAAIVADVATTLLGAYVAYRVERRTRSDVPPTFLGFLLPRAVFLHRSAFLDYQVNLLQWILPIPFTLPTVIGLSTIAAVVIGGNAPPDPHASMLPTLICAGILAIAADFTVFASHVLQHKVTLFWEFHKIHHSAEVLTPPTLNRTHPLQDIPAALVMTTTYAAILIAYSHIAPVNVGMTLPLSFDIVLWMRILLCFRLRHSHITMFFPDWITAVFMSPAHHQTHHSSLPRHFDCNYGLNLSIWDRLFGTLVTPEHQADYRLGLSNYEEREFNQSAFALYWIPFRNIWRFLVADAERGVAGIWDGVVKLMAPPKAKPATSAALTERTETSLGRHA